MIYLKICYSSSHLIHEQVAAMPLGTILYPLEELPNPIAERMCSPHQLIENAEHTAMFTNGTSRDALIGNAAILYLVNGRNLQEGVTNKSIK